MAYLKVVGGPSAGQILQIKEPRCVLGRHPDCDIPIDHLDTSRHHAQVTLVGGEFFLEDLHSRNGTWLNGDRIGSRERLRDGDSIRISESLYEFCRTPSRSPVKATTSVQVAQYEGVAEVRAVIPCDAASPRDPGGSVPLMRAVINALLEIAQSLRKTLALDEVFPQVLDSLFKIFPAAEQGFIAFRGEEGDLVPRCVKVREQAGSQEVRISTTIVGRVMDSQQAILSADAACDFRFKASESLVQAPIRSVMCAPLIDADGETFGAIQMDTVNYRGQFQEDDLHVFVAVATQASIAFDNARLHEMALRQREIERDLELADQIQRSFLPAGPPELAGYRFFDYYHPASYVGGDYYQYTSLPDGRLAIVVADVVGHGLAAAMLTAKVAAEARYQLLTESSPTAAIARLNRSLSAAMADNHFVTLVLVVLDPKSGQLTVVNAGHPPPLICPPGGQAAEIDAQGSGFPLGVEKDAVYKECALEVPRGGLVAVYTDGIREAVNAERESYGLDRLCKGLQATSGDPRHIGQHIVDDVLQFIANNPQADDMCLVCFRRE